MLRSAATVRIGVAAALLWLLPVAGVGAQPTGVPTVADLAVPSWGRERILFIAVPQPRATVILLSGGRGMLAIDDAGTIRPDGNFLVRTRALWAAQGFDVVVAGPPNGGSLLGQRHLPAYRAALDVIVGYARTRAAAPVWIIGTSQGAIGAVNGGHLAPKAAGIVLTSAVSAPNHSGETVFDADPGTITVPALIVGNTGDSCIASPPANAPRILAALAQSPRKEVMLVESHEFRSAPCQGSSPHGYLGIEAEVVRRIAEWIRSSPGR